MASVEEPGESGKVRVVRVSRSDLPQFKEFMRADAAVAEPGNPAAPDTFVNGLERALAAFDFLSSDSHWLLAGELDGAFVGYLTAVRVHKIFGRVAMLYVDGLSVLPEHRRKGVAKALWAEVEAIAREVGAAEIQLTVNAGNDAARAFYRTVGMKETPLFHCRKGVSGFAEKTVRGNA